MSDAVKPYAKQLEADIESYLESGNKDMSSKCLIAQDILRHVRPRHIIALQKAQRKFSQVSSASSWFLLRSSKLHVSGLMVKI